MYLYPRKYIDFYKKYIIPERYDARCNPCGNPHPVYDYYSNIFNEKDSDYGYAQYSFTDCKEDTNYYNRHGKYNTIDAHWDYRFKYLNYNYFQFKNICKKIPGNPRASKDLKKYCRDYFPTRNNNPTNSSYNYNTQKVSNKIYNYNTNIYNNNSNYKNNNNYHNRNNNDKYNKFSDVMINNNTNFNYDNYSNSNEYSDKDIDYAINDNKLTNNNSVKPYKTRNNTRDMKHKNKKDYKKKSSKNKDNKNTYKNNKNNVINNSKTLKKKKKMYFKIFMMMMV